MTGNYRFKIESNKRGIEVKVSDFQPVWVTITEGALLLGALCYTYFLTRG